MYEMYFGLRENPFLAGHQSRFIYPSGEHLEALAHLRYGIENREAFVLISGEVGTGKTTALYHALEEWESRAVVALITNSALTRSELLEEIAIRFGLSLSTPITKPQIMVQLERHLLSVYARGHRAILLLDEAQNLERDLLEEIRLLSNLEAQGSKLVQIFLVGQPELEVKLASPELRQLRQRIAVHYRLGPLSAEDTERYIHHRIAVAGGHGLSLFPIESCRAVHRFTHGIPREINSLSSQALLSAFVDDSPIVTPKHIETAARELEFLSVIEPGQAAAPGAPDTIARAEAQAPATREARTVIGSTPEEAGVAGPPASEAPAEAAPGPTPAVEITTSAWREAPPSPTGPEAATRAPADAELPSAAPTAEPVPPTADAGARPPAPDMEPARVPAEAQAETPPPAVEPVPPAPKVTAEAAPAPPPVDAAAERPTSPPPPEKPREPVPAPRPSQLPHTDEDWEAWLASFSLPRQDTKGKPSAYPNPAAPAIGGSPLARPAPGAPNSVGDPRAPSTAQSDPSKPTPPQPSGFERGGTSRPVSPPSGTPPRSEPAKPAPSQNSGFERGEPAKSASPQSPGVERTAPAASMSPPSATPVRPMPTPAEIGRGSASSPPTRPTAPVSSPTAPPAAPAPTAAPGAPPKPGTAAGSREGASAPGTSALAAAIGAAAAASVPGATKRSLSEEQRSALPPRLRAKLKAEEEPADEPVAPSASGLKWMIAAAIVAVLAIAAVLVVRFGGFQAGGTRGAATPPRATPEATATPPFGEGLSTKKAAGEANGAGTTAGSPGSAPAAASPGNGAGGAAGTGDAAASAPKPAAPPATGSATPAQPETQRPKTPPVAKPAATAGPYGLAVGTYLDQDRAKEISVRLSSQTQLRSRVVSVQDGSSSVYRLVLGTYESPTAAERAASDLIARGLVNEARVVPIASAGRSGR